MTGRFWSWQIFHTPSGFATTNNPCEVFNASIKRYTLRKALDIGRLVKKLIVITEDTTLCPPVNGTSAAPLPPQEAKQLAKVLVSTNRVAIYRTDDARHVLVHYVGDQSAEEPGDLTPAMRTSRKPSVVATSASLSDAEKKSAADFYRASVKWAVRRAHHDGMPREGWAVDIEASACGCKYFAKFGVCAHVICARVFEGRSVPGVNAKYLKFKDRRIRLARVVQRPVLGGVSAVRQDTQNATEQQPREQLLALETRRLFDRETDAQREDPFDFADENELEVSDELHQSLQRLLRAPDATQGQQSNPFQHQLRDAFQGAAFLPSAGRQLISPGSFQHDPSTHVLLNPPAAQGRPARAASALSIQFLVD